MSFHDVRFPTAISLGATGGPERRTDIVVLGSGFEERNSRWANSRHTYDAGYGVRSFDDLQAVIAFFEERRGRLYGFRWKDHLDFKSCVASQTPSALDQTLGTGDGVRAAYQLRKVYGGINAPYHRAIAKPLAGSVRVAVNGTQVSAGGAYVLNATTGQIVFQPGSIPPLGSSITAGFEFDVPVRFDTDKLTINLTSFRAGTIPHIPIVEVRL
jgi:uncharacterized protein (TIGR02217 family)